MNRPRYAFHGTSKKLLKAIKEVGLVPSEHERFIDRPVLWFTDDSLGATAYGRVVLRFAWPNSATFDDDPHGFGQYVTPNAVLPSDIEIWEPQEGRWELLIY